MFRHVVLFRWKPGTAPAELAALEGALAELPAQVPEIRAYRFGRDAGLVAGNFDFAIVADFADEAAWRRYVDHPAHQKLVAERVRPILQERAAAQVRTQAERGEACSEPEASEERVAGLRPAGPR